MHYRFSVLAVNFGTQLILLSLLRKKRRKRGGKGGKGGERERERENLF